MTKGTALLVPGNFGSALADVGGTPAIRPIWLNPLALLAGRFVDLSLPPPAGVTITATGFIPVYCSLLENALRSAGYVVVPFSYDWRQNIDDLAPLLGQTIVASKPPVYLVTHSLGSLVARRALQQLATQRTPEWVLSNVGALVMLGPCTSGTLSAALGLAGATNQLPGFNTLPTPPPYVQKTLATFTSLYQALPFDSSKLPSLDDPDHNVRTAGFWGSQRIDVNKLLAAIPPGGPSWAATIDTAFMAQKSAIILGDAPQTAGGVRFQGNEMIVDSYVPGDGFMAHNCSTLAERPATYLASGVSHLHLTLAKVVIQAVIAIFQGTIPRTVTPYDA